MKCSAALWAGIAAWSVVVAIVPASAQDFATPARLTPLTPGALLEDGLPSARPDASALASSVRWLGLAALTTRATAASFGWRAGRAALGVSQTGESDVGWTALGAALGVAGAEGGAAVRAVARRDRLSAFAFDAPPGESGIEVGAGAWVEAGPGLRVWASAPQLWLRGAAPPLARPLTMGAALECPDIATWLVLGVAPGTPRGSHAEHAAGVAVPAGPLLAWLSARDQPLRGGVGLAAALGVLSLACEVEGHPVLGETVRVSVQVGAAGRPHAAAP